MKTFADLKIGDTVFFVGSTEIQKHIVTGLCGKYAVEINHSYSHSTKDSTKWSDIKDKTSCQGYYDSTIIYCNMSEALLDLKESYKKRIDSQWAVVQKEIEKFIALKNEVYKYL